MIETLRITRRAAPCNLGAFHVVVAAVAILLNALDFHCRTTSAQQADAAEGDSRATDLQLFELKRPAMGVQLVLQAWAPDPQTASAALQEAAARVEELESVLSNYRESSEVSRVAKQLRSGEPLLVSADLWEALTISRRFWELSDGRFDVTVEPLSQLWRESRKSGLLPDPAELLAAQRRVGFGQISMLDDRHIRGPAGMEPAFDFGAMGKGMAADEAIEVLRRHGLTRCLAELGGDLALGDPPPRRNGWRIALAPFDREGDPVEWIELSRCGVATSGNQHQFVEIDGVRYSHLMDPRTGQALTRSTLVTAIAPTGGEADALATVFSLFSPDESIQLANSRPGIHVRGEEMDAAGTIVRFTSRDFPSVLPIGR